MWGWGVAVVLGTTAAPPHTHTPVSHFSLLRYFPFSISHSLSLLLILPQSPFLIFLRFPVTLRNHARNPRRVKLILSLTVCLPPSVVTLIKPASCLSLSQTHTQIHMRTRARALPEGLLLLYHQRQPNNKTYSRRFADNTDRIKMNLASVNHRRRVMCGPLCLSECVCVCARAYSIMACAPLLRCLYISNWYIWVGW